MSELPPDAPGTPAGPLHLEWLETLTAALGAAVGIRSVSMDPAQLEPLPGVLIKPRAYALDLLAGFTPTADLYVVVGDQTHDRALAELVPLANAVLEVIDPAGPIRLASLAMPDGAALPALLIPYDDPTT